MAYTLEKDFAEVTSAEQIEDCALRAVYEMLIRNRNKDEVPSSAEDVALGRLNSVLEDVPVEEVRRNVDECLKELETLNLDNLPHLKETKNVLQKKYDSLPPSEPVNPYEELEENGKYKVVERVSDRPNDLWHNLKYDDSDIPIGDWVSHKDFAGYVHSNGELSDTAWSFSTDHAIGVRFKVGE